MLRLEGFEGGWMGGPITTPGLTVEMEKGGLERWVVIFSSFWGCYVGRKKGRME